LGEVALVDEGGGKGGEEGVVGRRERDGC